MDGLFCQSCGMPLDKEELFGTDKNNAQNNDYCVYCYKAGDFTQDVSMEEMIEISLKHMREMFKDDPNFSERDALKNMREFFPKLKRWAV